MAMRASLLLIAFIIVLFPSVNCAADAPKFSGSTIKPEAALSEADVVLIGKITDPGVQGKWQADVLISTGFFHVKLKTLQLLQGSFDDQNLVEFVAFHKNHETKPRMGNSYIFFLSHGGDSAGASIDPYFVLKLLPATDDNIAMVKKLILN